MSRLGAILGSPSLITYNVTIRLSAQATLPTSATGSYQLLTYYRLNRYGSKSPLLKLTALKSTTENHLMVTRAETSPLRGADDLYNED